MLVISFYWDLNGSFYFDLKKKDGWGSGVCIENEFFFRLVRYDVYSSKSNRLVIREKIENCVGISVVLICWVFEYILELVNFRFLVWKKNK